MSLEDRFSLVLFAVVFIALSAAGFAIGGSHPILNTVAFFIGAGAWFLAWNSSPL